MSQEQQRDEFLRDLSARAEGVMRDRFTMLPTMQLIGHRALLAHLTLLQLRSAMGVPVQNATLELAELERNCAKIVESSLKGMEPQLRAELLPIVREELENLFALMRPGATKLDAALAKAGRA